MSEKPVVGIIMGSRSDWPTLKATADVLDALNVPYETRVVSAHRTPKRLYEYASTARDRGLKVIIAGAGGALLLALAAVFAAGVVEPGSTKDAK